MSILIFFLVLFALVLVHEFGHFIAAKKTGMRVDEFGIGFPPKLFGVKKGETEYTFNLLPIGGFVKIFGEDSVEAQQDPEYDRSFVAKSTWKKAVVLVAGVTMNVLFAWLLFSIAFGYGVQSPIDESAVTDTSSLIVTNVIQGSPAEAAGLTMGSVITGVSVGGDSLDRPTPSQFSAFIESHTDGDISVAYRKGGESMIAVLRPETNVIAGEEARPAIGVQLELIDVVSRPPLAALSEGFTYTIDGVRIITIGIGALLWDAVTFKADLSQVAGPVGIVGLVDDASALGFTSLLMFTGFISLNLAVINLLPFPALDGGRLLFVVIEAIKGAPITPKYVYAMNAVGFALLIVLMVLVTVSDISKLF